MHFSLLTLLVSAATLVQSAPSINGVAAKLSRSSLPGKTPARKHAIRLSEVPSNPMTIPIFANEEVVCNATSAAAFVQRILVMPSTGGSSGAFVGSGENVPIPVSPSSPDDTFVIPAQGHDYDLIVAFQSDNGSGSGFQNSFVNNPPTVTGSDETGTDQTVTSEDSQDNDDNDARLDISTFTQG